MLQEDRRRHPADGGRRRQDEAGLYTPPRLNQELYSQLAAQHREDLTDALNTREVSQAGELRQSCRNQEEGRGGSSRKSSRTRPAKIFDALKERIFRDEMLKKHRRPDGRAFDEIRAITIETGVLPRTHGSALFTRGETQALVTVTLGTKDDEQRIELLEPGEASKRFMLHYNFPPFSVGEVGFMRGPGRREIGHGALAERSASSA